MRWLICWLIHFPIMLFAGGDPLPMGARSAGMGLTGITLIDLWGLRLNPAGIAGLDAPVAGLLHQSHFLSAELSDQALAVSLPLGNGSLGIAADRSGHAMYRETHVSLAYAMRFGEGLRAAVQIGHLGVRLGENYGSAGALVAEAGMQARLTEAIWLGVHLFNPGRASIGGPYEDRIPTLLRAGLTYTFSDRLLMNAEVEKDIDHDERYRMGIEYRPHERFFLRTGISTAPMRGHFGAGVRTQRLEIDLAVVTRTLLGPTPSIGINYRFG